MSNMGDREKAFENKFALDQEVMFRIEARACKLFGLWIAEKLGLSEEDSKKFAATVVSSNLQETGFEDVKRAVRPALSEKGIDLADDLLDAQLKHFMEEARIQIMNEQN